MTMCKRLRLLFTMILIMLACGGCQGPDNDNGTTKARDYMNYDFNSVPDEVRAIKYDPFVNVGCGDDYYGDNMTVSIGDKLAEWKEIGFNTIYMIGCYINGSLLYPMEGSDHPYNEERFGPDFIAEVVEECKKQEMCLFVGAWMFRDKQEWNKHPEWRQKMSGQLDANEGLLCPYSPYMEEVFYPYFEGLYERYGIRNFFLQEMWFNWDGLGRSSSFSSYSIAEFNKLTGSDYNPGNVGELERLIGTDETVRSQWYQMHFDKEVEIIDRLKSIGGGTIAWHNLREAEWSMVMENSSRLEGVFINFMSLYPDIQIWDAKSTDDLDPYLSYKGTSDFARRITGFRKILEYYSLYGMAGLSRNLVAEDFLYLYLAARAAGISELAAEQDAFIERADKQNPVAWDAIKMTYEKYDPLFVGAEYIGTSGGAAWADGEESTTKNRRFLTSWQNGDREIVIAGVSLYKDPVELTFTADGKTVTDIDGNVITDRTVTIGTGEVKVFLIGEK